MRTKSKLSKSCLVLMVLLFSIVSSGEKELRVFPRDVMNDMVANPGKVYTLEYPGAHGASGFSAKSWHDGTFSNINGEKIPNIQFKKIADHGINDVSGQGAGAEGDSDTGGGQAGVDLSFDLQGFAMLDLKTQIKEGVKNAEENAQKQADSDFAEFEKSHPNGENTNEEELNKILLNILKKEKFIAEHEGDSSEFQGNSDPNKIIEFLLENNLLSKIPVLLAPPSSKDHSSYQSYFQSGKYYLKYNDKLIENTKRHLKKEWELNDKIADFDPQKLIEINPDISLQDGDSSGPENRGNSKVNQFRKGTVQGLFKNAESDLISVGSESPANLRETVGETTKTETSPSKKPEEQRTLYPNELATKEKTEKENLDHHLKKLYDKYSRLTTDQKISWSSTKIRKLAELLQDKYNLSEKFLQSNNAEAYVEVMAVANEAIEGVIETGNFLLLDDLYKSITGLDPESNKLISNTERSLALIGLVGGLGAGATGKAGTKTLKSQIARVSKLMDKLAVAKEVKRAYHTTIRISQRIGVKTNEALIDFIEFSKRTFESEIGATGKNISELVESSLNSVTKASQETVGKVYQGTFESSEKALAYHLMKHGKGRTAKQYVDDATNFFKKNKHLGKPAVLQSGSYGLSIKTKTIDQNGITKRVGGFFTEEGKVVTFWD